MTTTVRTIFSINATDRSHDFLVIRRGPAGISIEAQSREDEWESATAGPFTPEQLRAALDEVAPAATEAEVDTLDAKASRLAAFGRSLGYPPEWTNAPAVIAWHRSDGRTEHDGTPGKPRIWSPDYRTTERWSTPSLRNVHWSDLVDVVPLAAPAGSYTRTDESRPLTPDVITDEMVERGARQYVEEEYVSWRRTPETVKNNARESVRGILRAGLTEPTRPEGAEEMESFLAGLDYLHDETGASRADLATLANDLAMLIVEQP